MPYLFLIPSAVAGLMVSWTDIRTRRVPLPVVTVGCIAQIIAWCIWYTMYDDVEPLLAALLLGIGSAIIQLAFALIKPGHLGFGDVTCTLLIGLAVGRFGMATTTVWWFLMGAIGLLLLAIQHGRGKASIPFAPAIVLSGLLAVITQS